MSPQLTWHKTGTDGVWIVDSGIPGETSGLVAGIHGDERAPIMIQLGLLRALGGPAVSRELIGDLDNNEERMVDEAADLFEGMTLRRGRLIIALGSLAAIQNRSRMAPDGRNLNRDFLPLTPEQLVGGRLPDTVRRAQELMPFFLLCSALLDLHEYNKNQPFLIAEPGEGVRIARQIGGKIITIGFKKIEPGAADAVIPNGVAYELGNKVHPERNIALGALAIRRFLGIRNHTDEQLSPPEPAELILRMVSRLMRTSDNFIMPRQFKPFEILKAGQLLFTQDGIPQFAEDDQAVVFSNPQAVKNTEACCLARILTTAEIRELELTS